MEPLGVHLTWPDCETRPTMHYPTVSFIEIADCVQTFLSYIRNYWINLGSWETAHLPLP